MSQNAIPAPDVAGRIAAQTLAKRGADYASEVRRLLDAALELIRSNGTSARPRVADIVAAAGLSNDAFYRHFPSKDALVAALVEDGTERLASYLAHQMGKEVEPAGQIRRWMEGVLSQAEGDIAATTLAVLWNGSGVAAGSRPDAASAVGALLVEPLRRLGSAHPRLDASLVAHAALGKMSEYLATGGGPAPGEVEHMVELFLRGAAPPGVS
ncbi:MAG: TetR/AcrR family transcriptional regulator [Actinomycetota bacterium]|nr:TetR/AcrR family transcriptional regulator [Actinomycetota bacterium]